MDWLFNHPYRYGIIGTALLLAVGLFIVDSRGTVNPSFIWTQVWYNPGGISDPTAKDIYPTIAEDNSLPFTGGVNHDIISPIIQASPDGDSSKQVDIPEFNNFVQKITNSSSDLKNSIDSVINDAYGFLPTGLMSTTTASERKTPEQAKLYEYGNTVGNIIKSYEDGHTNQPAILKDYMQDRDNQTKIDAMKTLGNDMMTVGDAIFYTDTVPPFVKPYHDALIARYRDMGANLAAIPDAKRDNEVFSAIETYDASADAFVKSFVNMVLLFQSYGVKFANGEPGAVFMFTSQPSL